MSADPIPQERCGHQPRWIRCHTCRELKPCVEFPIKTKNYTGHRGICLLCEPPAPPEPEPEPEPTYTRHELWVMCKRKTRHPTKARALRSAIKRARYAVQIRTYECPACGGWHLTSRKERDDGQS